jgi:hypothetical protein
MKMKRIMKFRGGISRRSWLLGFLLATCGWTVSAQTTQTQDQQNLVKKTVKEEQVINNNHQVITNFWHDNWFVFGDAGGLYCGSAESRGEGRKF